MPEDKMDGGMSENHNHLDGFKVAILVNDGFEQVEMTKPKHALEKAGVQTMIISPKAGQVQGFDGYDNADTFQVDISLEDANPDDFGAVLLPGGAVNADKLRMFRKAREFVKQIDEADKGSPSSVTHRGC